MNGNGTYSWADGQQYPPPPLTTSPRLRVKYGFCAGTKAIGLTAREAETASKDGLTAEFTKADGAAAIERAQASWSSLTAIATTASFSMTVTTATAAWLTVTGGCTRASFLIAFMKGGAISLSRTARGRRENGAMVD